MPNSFLFASISPPSALASPTSSGVTAQTACLASNVDDGGQAAAGGGQSSYVFQYGTDPNFGSYSSTATASFSGYLPNASAGRR
jgi:hypothetical protein